VKETTGCNRFTQFIEALHSSLGLQDLDLNAFFGQNLQGFRTDLQSLPDTS
jgi:hypothetical protein